MEIATPMATDKQRAFLQKLMLSSTFTAEEAHRTSVWLCSPQATEEATSRVIDKALKRLKARDDSKKDSADRKAEYHANKENGGGEYPPRRYSQDHPPNGGNSPNGKPSESASVPAPARKAEDEQKIYRINGVDYTDKNDAAAAASKAIFG
ncbi:MAG: hypothetical protein F4Y39_08610 [Gemmatimonadetes bacterium]|nr:hypothetical protein [Gemmatimonadota bacterium]MYK51693.1 hypothetical protein [Gemmatimonadota bacterium]